MSYLGNNEDGKRELATIQKIKELKPIKKADRIEVAVVNGWETVVKKGEFEVGDKCVYIEIDALLPMEDKYSFLEKSSYKKENEYNREGYKLHTARLMGQISQGLALPLNKFDKKFTNYEEGRDVSEELNIVKYLKPEVTGNFGNLVGSYSKYSSKTDELRLQSNLHFLDVMEGKPYYITEKADGTSTTLEFVNGEFNVYGRNRQYKLDEDSVIKKFIQTLPIEEAKRYGKGFILKGELVGPKIQGNKMGLKQLEFQAFTLEYVEEGYGVRQSFTELKELCNTIGVKTVKLVEEGDSFNYTLEDLLEKAKGNYEGTDTAREGIVIRLDTSKYATKDRGMRELSFKVINNDFLLNK